MREWPVLLALVAIWGIRIANGEYPNEGCFWTGNCVNGWMGGCGEGRVVVAKSENCAGLCPPPQYQPCPLFTTHFQCCNHNKPRVSNLCPKCNRRVDFGKAYLCCDDCSEPIIADKDTGEGFCLNGARLAITMKPTKAYTWQKGEWGNCSAACGGGLRTRQLACHKLDPATGQPSGLHVDSDHCHDEPASQEACNLHPCPKPKKKEHKEKHKDKKAKPKAASFKKHLEAPRGDQKDHPKRRHMSGWLVTLFVLLGLVVVGGAGTGGYLYYKRTQNTNSGFVYVMLEGYN